MAAKVLIVEDHPDYREIVKIRLQAPGCQVIEATSAEEGLEKALNELPDVVIMDLRLPGIDGIAATAEFKTNPKTARVPVVAYTAWPRDYQVRAESIGVDAFLVKPAPTEVFKEVIQRLLHTRASS